MVTSVRQYQVSPLSLQKVVSGLFALSLVVMLIISANLGMAVAITNGYATNDTQLKIGMAVSLTSDASNDNPLVERATVGSPNRIIGVTVDPGASLVSTATTKTNVFVATTGQTPAYVVDVNGEIKKGDNLAISP